VIARGRRGGRVGGNLTKRVANGDLTGKKPPTSRRGNREVSLTLWSYHSSGEGGKREGKTVDKAKKGEEAREIYSRNNKKEEDI